MENKSARPLICPDCGGEFSATDLLDGDSVVTCFNCGKKYNISEILHKTLDERVEEIKQNAYRDVETERIKSFENVEKEKTQAYREVEEGKLSLEREKIQREINKEKKEEKEKDINIFKKSRFSLIVVVFMIASIVLAAFAFKDNKILSGVFALAMSIGFVICFLMGIGVIPERIRGIKIVSFIIASALALPCIFTYIPLNNGDIESPFDNEVVELQWDGFILGSLLPEPSSNKGIVHADSDSILSVTIRNITKSDYTSYKSSCILMGFNIDAENSTNNYKAFNVDGYNLSVTYHAPSSYSKEEMQIRIEEPISMTSYNWPNTGIGSKLPSLLSGKGKISTNSSDTFTIYVGNVTIDDFNDYVDTCLLAGYNVDYIRYEKSFYADNNNGDHLTITYRGFNTIYINVYNW